MKNNILFIGIAFTILNTITGLLLKDYVIFNMIFADVSILFSTSLLYFLFSSSISDGFKIGVGFVTILTGIGRFLCALFSINQLENNSAIIIFLLLITIELSIIFMQENYRQNEIELLL